MYVVYPDWLRPRSNEVEEFSLIVKDLHKYIGSSSPLVNVASSREVLFLHPGVLSLTDEDAQGKNKAKGKDREKA
ncbi:hypothetical protein FF1_009506 [Malus domestica]